jgi:hypothetical protein
MGKPWGKQLKGSGLRHNTKMEQVVPVLNQAAVDQVTSNLENP